MPRKKTLRSKVTEKMFEAEKSRPSDAIELLKTDHKEATALFKKFFKARTAAQKKDLVGEICLALSIHMRIEEEIFYPAVKQALGKDDKELVPEARVEHSSLKKLITEVEAAEPDEEFDARVQVMCEYTSHHVKEEETKMFPKVRDTDVDLEALCQKLLQRKLALMDSIASKASGRAKPPRPSSLFKGRGARGSARSSSSRSTGRSHARH
ncbi:MAG TPA: hemerythrin domain-containing protein [Gammaproteobacteria bacterium]